MVVVVPVLGVVAVVAIMVVTAVVIVVAAVVIAAVVYSCCGRRGRGRHRADSIVQIP